MENDIHICLPWPSVSTCRLPKSNCVFSLILQLMTSMRMYVVFHSQFERMQVECQSLALINTCTVVYQTNQHDLLVKLVWLYSVKIFLQPYLSIQKKCYHKNYCWNLKISCKIIGDIREPSYVCMKLITFQTNFVSVVCHFETIYVSNETEKLPDNIFIQCFLSTLKVILKSDDI